MKRIPKNISKKIFECSRGNFQYSLLRGLHRWSLASLKGDAKSYYSRYKRSMINLVSRINNSINGLGFSAKIEPALLPSNNGDRRWQICLIISSDNFVLKNGIGYSIDWNTELPLVERVYIPEEELLNPTYQTFRKIDKYPETRRKVIEGIGISKTLDILDAEIVSVDTVHIHPDISDCITRALIKDVNGEKWLLTTDGSTGRVYLLTARRSAKTPYDAHKEMIPFIEELNDSNMYAQC